MKGAAVSWPGQTAGPALVASTDELDAIMAGLQRQFGDSPELVFVKAHERQLTMVMGGEGTFVQIGSDSETPPYWVAVYDAEAEGDVTFMLSRVHATEVAARHVMPTRVGWELLRHFFLTGQRSSKVGWMAI